jgi:glycosyltransferase involved in cell wall biosynthesis
VPCVTVELLQSAGSKSLVEEAVTSTSSDTRIAVVIPVYRARFLAEALRSVFAQSRQPDEVVLVDDGSPDQDELAHAIAPYGDRLLVLRQVNQGAATARNLGIATTTAPFVALLDADDLWGPDFLQEQLSVLIENPAIDLVYSDGLVTGNTGLAGQNFMTGCPSEGLVTLESLLAQRCTVLLSAVVARRSAILDAGGFDPDLRRGQDFDLWLRMARRGAGFAYQRKALVMRRVHDDNLSGTSVNEAERPLNVLEKTVRTMTLSDRERTVAERQIRKLRAEVAKEQGKEFLRLGQFDAARREFARARNGMAGWKIRAALLGLHVAPQLMRRVYLARRVAA